MKIPKARINISDDRIRIRWGYGKNLRGFAVGFPNSKTGEARAEMLLGEINYDLQTGRLDPLSRDYTKYRPGTAGTNASEISAPRLFAEFTKYKIKEEALLASTVKAKYRSIERQLEIYLNIPAGDIDKDTAIRLTDVWAIKISPDTARQRTWLLASCWDWAKGRYHLSEDNPWKDMGRRFGKQKKSKPDPFDLDEVINILGAFRSTPEYSHYYDFAAFLLGTGCRIGEGIGIRWKSVAKDFSSVYICEAINKGVVGKTKTKESRDVPIPEGIAAMLRARKEAQQPKASDLVFTTPNGSIIDRDNFRSRFWRKALESRDIRYRSPGKARHTTVSHALASGANYIDVAKATGHSPLVMHKNYAGSINKKNVFVDFDSSAVDVDNKK
jgi:integrase